MEALKISQQRALKKADKSRQVFKNQEFANLPVQEAVDWTASFGRLMIHPHSGHPANHPEIHLVHRKAGNTVSQDHFASNTHSLAWHSDNTYEVQPPGLTVLYALEVPPAGGDTIFVDTVAAYQRLSPSFRERLHGLRALHSAHEQAQRALATGGYVRRDPIATLHPLVRTHPATGEKALFVNPQFTRYIEGWKKAESDHVLKFLYDHMAFSQDIQCRVKWSAGDVVVWDVCRRILSIDPLS